MDDRWRPTIATGEDVDASLDRSMADIAAGRLYDLADTIAEIEADIAALEGDRCDEKAEVGATGRK